MDIRVRQFIELVDFLSFLKHYCEILELKVEAFSVVIE